MKFIAALLLASFAGAAPTASPKSRSGHRGGRRADVRQSSRFHSNGGKPSSINNITNEAYDSNWAGIVINSPPSGTFTAVSGTFQMPQPTFTGGDQPQSASIWVGIDGASCNTAILQTGVSVTVNPDGSYSFDPWFEWLPDYAHDFTGIDFNVGDTVALSVVADSSNSGTATIQNLNTNQQVSQYLTSDSALCGQNAEWIVEDFDENGGMVPFANFNSVTFTDTCASTSDGNNYGASFGDPLDISQNGNVITSTSQDGNDLTISYVQN